MPSLFAPLGPPDLPRLLQALGSQPVPNVFMLHLARKSGLRRRASGPVFYGHLNDEGELIGAGAFGGSLLAWAERPQTIRFIRDEALRRCGEWQSLLGEDRCILSLWNALSPHFAPPQENRAELWLSLTRRTFTPHDEALPLRLAGAPDLPRLLPLRFSMYEEPEGRKLSSTERMRIERRCRESIRDGSLFVGEEDGRVVFTACFSASAPEVTQISSVCTHPGFRNRGIATAALTDLCLKALSRSDAASLFVAETNAPALRVYGKLGFRQTALARSIRLSNM